MNFVKLTPQKIKENNDKVRAGATPEQLELLKIADAAFEEGIRDFDDRLDGEAKLRAWASDLFGTTVDMSEVESLNEEIQKATPGHPFMAWSKRGGSVMLIKTYANTIDRMDRYVFTIEKALVDLINKEPTIVVPVSRPHADQFTRLSFRDLIKVAFKRLLGRG